METPEYRYRYREDFDEATGDLERRFPAGTRWRYSGHYGPGVVVIEGGWYIGEWVDGEYSGNSVGCRPLDFEVPYQSGKLAAGTDDLEPE